MIPLGLSFQNAPPFSVPFRFFATAVIFLLAAALLATAEGPSLLSSRHALATLAATHLVTLGFASMIMCGAMIQLLPVLAGRGAQPQAAITRGVHPLLTFGSAGVPMALMQSSLPLMVASAAALLAGFGLFIALMWAALPRGKITNPSIAAFRLSLVALAVTVTLGVVLGLGRHLDLDLPYLSLASLHPRWGIFGWMTLLIMGVAYQVIPMFQITPAYPDWIRRHLNGLLFALLAVRSLASCWPGMTATWIALLADTGMTVGALLFAVTTFHLQSKRKRRLEDASARFWQIGLSALIAGCLLAAALAWSGIGLSDIASLCLGVLWLTGFVVSIIQGMLCRIIPFLTWFHLQSAYPRLGIVPNVRQIQARFHIAGHAWTFMIALTLLLGSLWSPALFTWSGVFWIVNALWLGTDVIQAGWIFRHTRRVAMESKPH